MIKSSLKLYCTANTDCVNLHGVTRLDVHSARDELVSRTACLKRLRETGLCFSMDILKSKTQLPWFPKRRSLFQKIMSLNCWPSEGTVDPELQRVDWCLNILGTSPPIFVKPRRSDGTYHYEVNFKSPWTVAALMSGLLSIMLWVDYGLQTTCDFSVFGSRHSGLLSDMRVAVESNDKLNPKIVEAVVVVLEAIFIVVTVGEILETIIGWCTFPLFLQFINGWSSFENDCVSSVQKLPNLTADSLRIKEQKPLCSPFIRIGYVGGPTLAGIIFRIVKETRAGHSAIEIIKYCYFVLRFITVGLLTDIKHLFVYHSVSRGFLQIHQGIEATLAGGTVTAATVHHWRKSVEKVRRQCKLACKYQQPSQLLFVCRCTAQLTLFAFVILNTPRGDTFSQMFSVLWLAYCTLQILRLSVKMHTAKKIPSSERLIADSLSSIASTSIDQTTFNEVKFTFDLINQHPAEVIYGGFIKMETRLLAGMLGQVVTYLIVMMQYVQSL